MNFLSHFYFDRHSSAQRILGCLLPDLIKNAAKITFLNPLKFPEKFSASELHDIYIGWNNHIAIDKYFHASTFFTNHTQAIKKQLFPVTENSEIRPSFLAHIALELMLDHLLIAHNHIQVEKLYVALQESDKDATIQFLTRCNIADLTPILQFIDNFKASRYLFSYQKTENLAYALNRICMRLWPIGMEQEKVNLLYTVLEQYMEVNEKEMLQIFKEMDTNLSLNTAYI